MISTIRRARSYKDASMDKLTMGMMGTQGFNKAYNW